MPAGSLRTAPPAGVAETAAPAVADAEASSTTIRVAGMLAAALCVLLPAAAPPVRRSPATYVASAMEERGHGCAIWAGVAGDGGSDARPAVCPGRRSARCEPPGRRPVERPCAHPRRRMLRSWLLRPAFASVGRALRCSSATAASPASLAPSPAARLAAANMRIDGRAVAAARLARVARDIAELRSRRPGFVPGLTIVQVGDREDSNVYVRMKRKAAEEAGIRFNHIHLPATVTEAELLRVLRSLNDDAAVHGILVQMPLPSHISEPRIADAIDPRKDVDGCVRGRVAGGAHCATALRACARDARQA